MQKITKSEFRQAMVIVNKYCNQQELKDRELKAYEVGCAVKLNKFGLEMQGNGKKNQNKRGIVVDYIEGNINPLTDGVVTVKWNNIAIPDEMHVSQVEKI